MSVTIGTLAGTTGLGSERQVVVTASGDLWAFGFTGTATLATWYSQDGGQTWTAGGTLALASNHLGEGRNLGVAYRQIGGVDVVHVGIIFKSGTSLGAREVRATISGTTITFHSSVTTVASATTDGGGLYFSGIGLELTSDNKVHFASGFAGGGNGDVNSSDSTADPAGAEQATPVTWTSHVIDSNGVAHESRSSYVVDLGSTAAGLISDNGSDSSTTIGLNWATWNGSAWSSSDDNRLVTGTITAIDKNDWGAVAVSPSDVHVVYRNASGSLIHRRYDGTSWNAGETIPSQNNLAGGGIGLSSDGLSVWLCVIDTDSANTIQMLRWTSLAGNGIQDAWDSSWTALESTTATRTFLGCVRDIQSGLGLAYWTEGSSFVAIPFDAIPPVDPNGAFVQSWQGSSSSSSTTFGITATTQNVASGNRIIVAVTVWNAVATTITSVTDGPGNAYTKDNEKTESDGTHTSHWSAPIISGGGTKPTVTAHASAATAEWAMHCCEYANLTLNTSGSTDGTNATAYNPSVTPITSGASTPTPNQSGEIAFGSYGDGGNGITTIGVSAGWTQRGTSIQGTSTTAEQAVADQLTTSGVGSNASFTLSSTGSPAAVLVTVYKLAGNYVSPRVGRVPPQPWLARIMEARVKPLFGPPTSSSIALTSDPVSSGTVGAAAGAAVLSVALAAAAPAFSTASGNASLAKAFASATQAPTTGAGLLALATALQATSPATTGAQAALAEAVALAATSPAVSREAATLAEALALACVAPAFATAVANLQVLTGTQIAGLGAAYSTGVGTLSLAEALAATSPATSGAAGALRLAIAMAGNAPASSGAVGRLGLGIPLAGRGAAVSGASGVLAFIVGGGPVAPAVIAKLMQPGRAIVNLFGQRTSSSTGGRAGASTGGRTHAKPQEGRDDVEPQ